MMLKEGVGPIAAQGKLKLIGLTDDKLKVSSNEQKLFGSGPGRGGFKKKKIIIYFIGGITYAEIAAIRFLQILNPGFKFIIATTCIINGESALSQLLGPPVESHGLILSDIKGGK